MISKSPGNVNILLFLLFYSLKAILCFHMVVDTVMSLPDDLSMKTLLPSSLEYRWEELSLSAESCLVPTHPGTAHTDGCIAE